MTSATRAPFGQTAASPAERDFMRFWGTGLKAARAGAGELAFETDLDYPRERTLAEFTRDAWHVIEPATEFKSNWHIDAIGEHLTAVSDFEIADLLITIPPRHMNSISVSVMWPAWCWTERPYLRWIFSSYAAQLSTRDSLKCRRLIRSPWYQARFSDRYALTGDQNVKTRFENTATGVRIATSVGGTGTGEGGDILVVDDPHKVDEVESDTVRAGTIDWWDGTMSTRINQPHHSGRVIVMQRVHEGDLVGHLLEKEPAMCELRLPAEYEPKRHTVTVLGWEDPRKKEDELLWEERFDRPAIEKMKAELGSLRAAGQLQQRPAPAEGTIVKNHWWKFYEPFQVEVELDDEEEPNLVAWAPSSAETIDEWIASWDMAFKDVKESSYVVGQIWARRGADCFLVDQVRRKMNFVDTCKALVDLSRAYPQARRKLVEDKANGPAVIAQLKRTVQGLIAEPVHGDKIARAYAVSPLVEGGNVYLPNPQRAAWVEKYLAEWRIFPNGVNDDQVDATTQALNRLAGRARVGKQTVVQWG